MKIIDRKYGIVVGPTGEPIIIKNNGAPIPDDKPLILFRARDRLALPMLEAYRAICLADGVTQYQIDALDLVIGDFAKFAGENPDRMKQPGITLGK
jgi:hypothetical protein